MKGCGGREEVVGGGDDIIISGDDGRGRWILREEVSIENGGGCGVGAAIGVVGGEGGGGTAGRADSSQHHRCYLLYYLSITALFVVALVVEE